MDNDIDEFYGGIERALDKNPVRYILTIEPRARAWRNVYGCIWSGDRY